MAANCTICDTPNSKACGSCKSSHYCSPECQQTDWPVHKLLCKAFKTLAQRPGPSYKLGILFPVDEKIPKLRWNNCEPRYDEEEGMAFESAKVSQLLGDDNPFPEDIPISQSKLRSFNLGRTILVSGRETFLIDGSETNQSVVQLTRGAMCHDWRGSFVALRQQGRSTDPTFYEDMTLADFRHVVDYFLSYGDEVVQGLQNLSIHTASKIHGVKVTCIGDQNVFGVEPYVPVEVPRDHQVFTMNKPTDISRLLEFPVLIRKYPPDRAWKDDREMQPYPYQNQAATFLHLNADPKSKHWGWAPIPEWQNDVGSVIVVRQDGKDLTTHQADALCHFCRIKMQPLFEDSLGGGDVDRTREEVMGFMTKKRFAAFFEEYRKEKVKEDPSWATAKSPYDS